MTLASIRAPRDHDTILEDLLTRAAVAKLRSRGWQPERIARVMFELQTSASVVWEDARRAIVEGGYPSLATGDYLDMCLVGFFLEARLRATSAIVQLRLTDTANAGPHKRPPGQIAVAQPSSATPLYYRSNMSIAVPKGGYTDVSFVAESPGAAYNVAPGAITELTTPIAGVTVTSPAIGLTGSCMVVPGVNEETDTLYLARCQDKWSLLGRGWSDATIRSLIRIAATAAGGSATRFKIKSPGGLPYVTDAYVANATGPITASLALACYSYLKDPTRRRVGAYPVRVYSATLLQVPLAVTLYSDGSNPGMQTDADARLVELETGYDLGRIMYASRIIDSLVDVATGCVAATIDKPDIEPGDTDSIDLVPTYSTVTV